MAFANSHDDKGRTYGIKRLTPTNYLMWVFNVQSILDEEDLWGIVDGSTVKPPTTDTDNLAAYLKKFKKCKRILISTMEEEVQKLIMRLNSPKEIWQRLEEVYRPKSRLRKIQPQREFVTVAVKDGEDLQAYVNRVRDLASEVERAGCAAPTDELITLTMLAGLPTEYNYIASLTDTYPDAEFMSHKVENLIVGEFRRRQIQDTGYISQEAASQSGQVLVVKQNASTITKDRKPATNKVKREDRRKCFLCNEKGHIAAVCPLKLTTSGKPKVKTKNPPKKTVSVVTNDKMVILSCIKSQKKPRSSDVL